MKPTRAHYVYAHNAPHLLWLVSWPLAAAALMAWALGPMPEMLTPLSAAAKSWLKLVGLAFALGFFAGGLVGVFVMGPIYYDRALKNGAPYAPGDRVELLVGRDRGKIYPVVEYSEYRMYVRLEDGRTFDVRKVIRADDGPAPIARAPAPAPTDGPGARPGR